MSKLVTSNPVGEKKFLDEDNEKQHVFFNDKYSKIYGKDFMNK